MMRRRRSLEARLITVSALWIVVALGVAAAVLAGLYRGHVEREHSERIGGHLEELAAALDVDEHGGILLKRDLSDPAFRRPYSGMYWDVSSGGQVVLRSRSLWDHALAATPAVAGVAPATLAGPEGQRLNVWTTVVRHPRHPRPIALRVAADGARVATMAASFTRTLTVSLALLAAGLLAAVYVQVRIGLAPLRRLAAAMIGLRAGDTDRIDGDYPSEVRPLVEDLNAVLHENRELLARARAQAGNLAHALKTPLAVIQNALPALEAAPGSETIAAEVGRMREAIERHLVRARVGATQRHGRHVEIASALEDVLRALRRMHGEGVMLDVRGDTGLRFRGDIADLQEVLGNLLDNAAKWARARARVTLSREQASVRIVVEDDGPGIPPALRVEAIQRGVRLDSTRPGTGLGLQIVDELCGVYGGSLELDDSPMGGLRATVRLPGG